MPGTAVMMAPPTLASSFLGPARLGGRTVAAALAALLLSCAAEIALAAPCQQPDRAEPAVLSIGLPPWSGAQLTSMWADKLDHFLLYQHCIAVSFHSDVDYTSFIRSAIAGKYDALVVPPHIGLYLLQQQGLRALARDHYGDSQVLYIVPVDSRITDWHQLVGMTVAVPDTLALVSLIAKQELAELMPPVRFEYYGKHDRVIRAVLKKHADAGVVFSPMLDDFRGHDHDAFRILRAVPFGADGLMLVRADMAEATRTQLLQALMQFETSISPLLRWQPVTAAELAQMQNAMAPYVAAVAEQLARANGPPLLKPKP